eukprot:c23139_g1_i2 orf=607-2016(-)
MSSVILASGMTRSFSSWGEFEYNLFPLAVAAPCAAAVIARTQTSASWCGAKLGHLAGNGSGLLHSGLCEASCLSSFNSQFHCTAMLGCFGKVGGLVSARQRLEGAVALMAGMSGGFWEGADSEKFGSRKDPPEKESSVLRNLIQEIQPLDVNLIGKDTSSDSTDAMKRTISGMLGLLPSDQFQVTVQASREPLRRLLVSSMMTGYTLRNAEYRLCLQRILELTEKDLKGRVQGTASYYQEAQDFEGGNTVESAVYADKKKSDCDGNNICLEDPVRELTTMEAPIGDANIPEEIGPLTPEAEGYIRYLQSRLSSVSKELDDHKLSNAGLQMQNFVGEEKNDLLDYLRSLEPDKVVELSQPTSSEVEDVIQQVIEKLLGKLSLKLHSKASEFGNGTSTVKSSWEQEGGPELVGNPPLQFQSTIEVTRDYLARFLFWCMLLGHYMRGLEYRLQLSHTLSLSGDIGFDVAEGK